MGLKIRKTIAMLLAVAFVISLVPSTALAQKAAGDDPEVTTGTVQYAYELDDAEAVYRDDCFMRSSFEGCAHLFTLSAQAALLSGRTLDGDLENEKAEDISEFLVTLGFDNVDANAYYTQFDEANSAAVAVGERKIYMNGEEYTLLAIIPRSGGYLREWAGNFEVGGGDLHEGFMQGRDEILRFVKKYIADNEIEGNLKVWIAGYSRGAAMANLLGAFFAAGGSDYLGDVSVTPKDVYCYTFATPGTAKDEASLQELLSVSGDRTLEGYTNDTAGEAFVSEEEGFVTSDSEVFKGIYNFRLPYDLVTLVPMEEWGFGCFGRDIDIEKDFNIASDEMAAQLEEIDPYFYDDSFDGTGDYRNFMGMKFDLDTLGVAPDQKYTNLNEFISGRLGAIAKVVESNQAYAEEGYQETITAVIKLITTGGVRYFGVPEDLDTMALIKPIIVNLLAYGIERLKDEGVLDADATDVEGTSAVLGDILYDLIGLEVTEETTVDDVVEALLTYIIERKDTKLYQTLATLAVNLLQNALEGDDAEMLSALINYCVADPDNTETEAKIVAFIDALVYGPEEGSQGNVDNATAKSIRTLFLYGGLANELPGLADLLDGGEATLDSVVTVLVGLLLTNDDPDAEEPYPSMAAAADASLVNLLTMVADATMAKVTEAGVDAEVLSQFEGCFNTVIENVDNLRRLIFYFVLYEDGEEFNLLASVGRIITFVVNSSQISVSHDGRMYLAWAKALEQKGVFSDHVVYFDASAEKAAYVTEEKTVIKYTVKRSATAGGNIEGLFTGIKVDGDALTANDYAVSNIDDNAVLIELKSDFLDTLPAGAYTFKAEFTDGTADLNLTVDTTVTLGDNAKVQLGTKEFAYTGKALRTGVKVSIGDKVLVKGTDYTVAYSDNVAVGTAKVTITGIGNYKGSLTRTYKIVPYITKQPQAATVYYGNTARFTTSAAAGGRISYQWQVSVDGKKWKDSSADGADTKSLSVVGSKTLNGRYFRCKITSNGVSAYTDAVQITTKSNITTQPANVSAKDGSAASFTVTAKGSNVKYQWMVMIPGTDKWVASNGAGSTSNKLTVNAKKKFNGYKYRCQITNGSFKIYTKTVTLTVK
ncbi:MAG: lipase family protein [Eubacterium sp.]|nr:lipase family protein [Eubacterium sp.]